MNDQLLLLAEVRKQTKGVDMDTMVGRVEAVLDKQGVMVALEMDAVFALASNQTSRDALPFSLSRVQ